MRALFLVVILGLVGGMLIQTTRCSRLGAHHRALEHQFAELQASMNVAAKVDGAPPANALSEGEQRELLRLRNQAAQLRNMSNDLREARKQIDQLQVESRDLKARGSSNLRASTATLPTGAHARESWQFSGYATPEACLESTLYAISKADYRAIMGSLTAEEAQRLQKEMGDGSPEEIAEKIRSNVAKATSYEVLERKELSLNEVMLLVYAPGEEKAQRVLMRKIGEEWKFGGPADRHGQ